ncbi:leucine-rich repeat receptor-like kinase protein CLV1B [Salvia hispanica]|uniref:leucine-rich repeat receptor-like kinase protein CLV1B n=1 Tax=Salvia hispanica TaxID=49212 RepID=UPI002009CB4A|nr:leucine-rich repeat receptor-like kinase protein CLV1B [Salvia hispanica]
MATSFLLPLELMLLITLNIFFMLTSSAQLTDLTTDRDALLTFKKAITVDTRGALSKKWLTNTSICDWAGASCGIKHQRVTALDLSNFGLHGSLSPHLGNLTFLQSLDVSSNNFTGVLPAELSKLRHLKIVNATCNNFSGEIPRGILTNMSVLEYIDLRFNNLSGTLPRDICNNTPKLKTLTLITNQISGKIPRSIHKCSKMEELSLSTNMFNGNIPTEVGNLTMLTLLSIDDNDLQGNVTELESLDLSSNRLEGKIPTELTKLTFLSVMNLSMNNLSGMIPQSNGQFSTFENTSYVGNSRLCGFPLSRQCEGPSPPVMLEEDDHDYGILEGFCWQAVVSGNGCGFVIGAIVGCVILGFARPKWLVEWIYRFYRKKMRSHRRR